MRRKSLDLGDIDDPAVTALIFTEPKNFIECFVNMEKRFFQIRLARSPEWEDDFDRLLIYDLTKISLMRSLHDSIYNGAEKAWASLFKAEFGLAYFQGFEEGKRRNRPEYKNATYHRRNAARASKKREENNEKLDKEVISKFVEFSKAKAFRTWEAGEACVRAIAEDSFAENKRELTDSRLVKIMKHKAVVKILPRKEKR